MDTYRKPIILKANCDNVANSEQGVRELQTVAQQQQLLGAWNNTHVDYPQDACIHQLFEAQVERSPNAVAVVFEDQHLTYQELNSRANQLAHHLQALGVKPDMLVGVCVDRSVSMVVGMLGILKAGGAYVPLDPGLPQERLKFMLSDSQVSVLLTTEKLSARLPESEAQVICLDTDWDLISTRSAENAVSNLWTDNLVYVIYTSGSTGQPKGVMISHRSLCNQLCWRQTTFKLTAQDKVLQTISLSFDPSVWQIFWPLLFGAQLILASPGGHQDTAYLVKMIATEAITVIGLVPSILRVLLEEKGFENCTSLRHVTCGGEALPVELTLRFHAVLSKENILHNCYGPTEAAIDAAAWTCKQGTLNKIAPIGRPIANTQIYILDEDLQPVPVGVSGELHIGGVGLARGYLNRPQLTSEKFIRNPFFKSDEETFRRNVCTGYELELNSSIQNYSSERLYKTGDLGRYMSDGNIEFLGRIDHQVKIRGFRIELGEIEAVLAEHPAIKQSLIIAREDVPGDKRLVAYVVANESQVLTSSELRLFLQDLLPEYMVPAAFVFLSALPLNPNGKVDRHALPVPDSSSFIRSECFVAPRTWTEDVLVAIWEQVLGLEHIGIHDNFFTLGGHSLLATQVISRVRETLCVDLPLRCMFELPTVAELASRAIATRHSESVVTNGSPLQVSEIERLSATENLELSFAQARLWFIAQLQPESPAYNLSVAYRLAGDLDIIALEQSLCEIVQRHSALRTSFAEVNGQPTQVITTAPTVLLPIVDLGDLPVAEREESAKGLATEFAGQPFDLATGPLWRVQLLRLTSVDHLLLVTIHHIVFDDWSLNIFLRELAALYEAFSTGKPSPLTELPIQYADFAHWQRQWLQGVGDLGLSPLESQLNYWKHQLASSPKILELPTDRPRLPVMTYSGARQYLELPKSLSEALKALSQRFGVTLYMTLLAAFKILLYRYSGQSDIIVGSPIANRNRAETEDLIGFFVNTLVLRTDLGGNPSVQELLSRIREVALGGYDHQDLPFEKLVEELHPERSLSYHPLFQVMFVFQNTPEGQLELPGLTLSPWSVESKVTKFDLTLELEETTSGLKGCFDYSTDLFDSATIIRMVEHFQTLLEGIVANPDQRVTELPLLTSQQRHQLLFEWNNTTSVYATQFIHQLFEEQVERTPDAVAVVFENQQLTYRELNQSANKIAHHLQALGVKPEVLVGMCVDRSIEMVVGLLGILKSGGVYVPLDPAYPQERLSYMLLDSQVSVLLTQQRLLASLSECSATVVCLDTDWEAIDEKSEHNPLSGVQPSDLAYVIYTSGSTGKPKGVLISHSSLANHCCAIQKEYQLNSSDCVLQFSSLNFDVSLEQIFVTLLVGAKLVVRGADLWTTTNFHQKIADFGITVVNLPPVYWQQLVQEWVLTPEFAPKNQLRLVLVGGDQMLPEGLNLWRQSLMSSVRLINAYGPTEATITATLFEITPQFDSDATGKKIPIGRPFANKTIYILDSNLQPVPIGVRGELYIGGDCLAIGYLNRPDLTQEKFIPNPFLKSDVSRLYKTGDLARYLPDAKIEYLGRIDHQVKIRGFRIELGEIEAVLVQHPQVRETVVIALDDVQGFKRLVAYVVAKTELTNDRELRRFLLQQLPDYMVPAFFVMLPALPLTPNGKVDRSALASVAGQPSLDINKIAKIEYVKPRNYTEEILAAIWVKILGLKQVGIHDNFFELGGHSLLATQVISQCRQAFCVEIPLQWLFEKSTIALLADAIAQSQTVGVDTNVHQIIPLENLDSAPLSFAQQRVWFLDQLEPNNSTYLLPTAQRLTGRLNVDVLLQSIDAIVAHHQVLRTNFISSPDGSPIQVIGKPRSVETTLIDLTKEADCDKQEQVQRILNQELQRPFDLTTDLMLRSTLVRIDQQEHILLLVMHHIASDGWSIGILWKQLAALYEAFLNDLPNPLPKPTIQYADFTVWQRQWLQEIGANDRSPLQTQLDYWKKQLAGANHVLELPTDRPRSPVQTYRGATQSLMLPQTLAASVHALSQQEHATLFMTLLAAFGTLLHRYTGQEDVNIGSPVAGRNRAEIEGLIGFFINTVVLRTNFSGRPSFRSLLAQVRQMALGAYIHQDMPFEKLVEELQIERDTSRNPLFQVWFNMLNLEDIQLELPGLDVAPVAMPEIASKFDLTLYVRELSQGIQLELVYNADLFAPERMIEMLSQFHHLLIQIVENPDLSIAQLSLVTPKAKLLLPNPTQPLANQWQLPVLSSFHNQAQRVPQQVAVVDAQVAWTYGELDMRANQLAHYLLANHLQSQDIVAIYAHRSATLVWAILGVLAAGCAFVILDPAYPASRLINCLEIAQPRAWLQIADEVLPTALQENVDLYCSCRLKLQSDSVLHNYPTQHPTVTVAPDDLAYVAFTSGSTGKPKGIKGTHRPLSHFVQWHCQTFGLNQSDKFSMLSGLSHDPLLRDIFTPLSLGATLYIPSQQDIDTPGQLAEWMQQKRVSIAHLTPAMAQVLTTNTESKTTDLRYLFFSGDVLTQQDVTRIQNFAPQAQNVNFYGATETPQAMGYLIIPNDGDRIFKQTIPLGRGIEGVQLLILTRMQQLAGIGEIGEIYVRTPYLAQGYLGNDQLTQERFIINPLTNVAEDRLYKTGDLGRYLPDAKIEFLGRIDHQVKIRGFRIELGEIAAILRQHPAVQETVVIALEDVRSEKYLVAYVVPKLEQVLTTSELRNFLLDSLPNYMIPSAFVILDALPLTQNGKLDRLALPVPELVRLEAEKTHVAPRNQLEQQLTQIWQQVLGIQPIGVRDNFFELGGHSLLAVKLFWRIEKAFGINLPLATLFQSATVEAQALMLSQQVFIEDHEMEAHERDTQLLPKQQSASWSSLVAIQPKGSKPPFFFVHPLEGNILSHYKLACYLDAEQPLYGLQAQGLDGQQAAYNRIEDMASHYIKEIKTVQPFGPYFIGGYSFGGLVAYEMAQQLDKQGEKVACLVLFDTSVPGAISRLSMWQRLPLHLKKLSQNGPAYFQHKLKGWLPWLKYLFKYQLQKIVCKFYQSAELPLPQKVRRVYLKEAHSEAAEKYIPQTYKGKVTLLAVEEQMRVEGEGFELDPNLGWSNLAAGGLEIHRIPGDHISLLREPHVQVVAEKLQACLKSALQ